MMRKMMHRVRALGTHPRRAGVCRRAKQGSERYQRYDPEGAGEKACHMEII
jgi:hypothetical protein